MTCERPYKHRQSPFQVIDDIQKKKYSEFDPEVVSIFVEAFIKSVKTAPVLLSNGEPGRIVFAGRDDPMHPVVKLDKNEKVLSLKDESSLAVMDLLRE